MASRGSLNKVLLIGNLTRDPELRYTPSGAAVCNFGLATNRVYTASDGTKKEEAEFHRIVSWNKLAELCSQLLTKGRKVFVEGRIQTRSWTTPAGEARQTTEIVIDDMKILDKRPEDLSELPEALPVGEPAISQVEEPKVAQPQAEVVSNRPTTRPAGAEEDKTQATKKKKTNRGKSSTQSEPEAKAKSEDGQTTSTEEESPEDLIKDLPF